MRFGAVVAVDDVSFRVEPGEVVGLIGPERRGQDDHRRRRDRLRPSRTAGEMSLGGVRDERARPGVPLDVARAGLRRSFQSLELFEDISVGENLHAGAAEHARASPALRDLFWPAPTGRSRRRSRAACGSSGSGRPRPAPERAPVRAPPPRRHRARDRVGTVGVAARRARRGTRRQRDPRARATRSDASPMSAAWPCS